MVIAARLIDIGVLDPALFHATYAGIAERMSYPAAPAVVWGRARAHISLGQSQNPRAELAQDIDVPAIIRPLGGGAVWIDEDQWMFVLVAPLEHAPRRTADWFCWGLAPAVATFQRFGLAVEQRAQDLWLKGRKIAGSGAATIGASAVFASSFLLAFPRARFARCIASPSPGFSERLVEGLELTMTSWSEHQTPPPADRLRRVFARAVEETLGWKLAPDRLTRAERAARREALGEMERAAVESGGSRLVPGGIRLNAESVLTETCRGGRRVRELIVGGALIRRDPVAE
jgi:lipoate-protein ligase A